MEKHNNSTAGTTTVSAWVVANTVVFRLGWTWAGPSPQKQSAPEPPVRGEQGGQFGHEGLHAPPLPVTEALEDQALVSAGSGDRKPAHEDLLDPDVEKFVAFRYKDVPAVTPEKGDVKVTNAYHAISPYVTLKQIYRALIKICRDRNAERIAEGIWRIEVNYPDFAIAAQCSARSISDAIPELAAHGYVLRHPEKWGGKHASQYYVRDEAGMMTILQAAGVEYSRKMGGGHIALFRLVDEVKDDVIARI